MQKWTVTLLATLTLMGCKSTPDTIEPRPFDTNSSYAYNVANQTALTRNDSPLRDLTAEEAKEVSDSINSRTGGDTSILFGTLSILTGNLTGIIDVVGGSAANLANSNHTAAYGRWFVELPKSEVESASEAWQKAAQDIRTAQRAAYSQYGTVNVQRSESGAEYLVLEANGKKVPFGGVWNSKSVPSVTETSSSYLINYTGDAYTFFIQPSIALALYVQLNELSIDPVQMYKAITKELPEGFYLYVPSFQKQYFNDGAYIDLFHRVPAIYTQGKKYDFIKP